MLTGDDTLLQFNLAHDTMVRFKSDDRAYITSLSPEMDEATISLDKRGQLLLLDALCSAYGFESPVASIVTKQIVHDSDEVAAQAHTITDGDEDEGS